MRPRWRLPGVLGLPRGSDSRPPWRSWWRHTVWRNLFHAIGGFRVTGTFPDMPVIVVANHASHADTPALLAALPATHQPVVVAAGDYWFTSPWRRRFVRVAINAIPVDRTSGGGYPALRESAAKALGEDSSVVLFPEGTRTTTGEIGTFHTGPLRLAVDVGVPLVPVAVVGAGELLPKRGRLMPGPVEVRVGRAMAPRSIDPEAAEDIAGRIAALVAQGPATPSTSQTWRVLHHGMARRRGLLGAAAWGFAEGVSWPITQEVYLATAGASHLRRLPQATLALTAGSVLGVLVTAVATRAGHRPPQPMTTPAMRERARADLAHGARGFWRQALNGVPVKVYAAAAGELGLPLGRVAMHAAGARGARALGVVALPWVLHRHLEPVLRRFFGPYLAGFTVVFGAGLRRVYRGWLR